MKIALVIDIDGVVTQNTTNNVMISKVLTKEEAFEKISKAIPSEEICLMIQGLKKSRIGFKLFYLTGKKASEFETITKKLLIENGIDSEVIYYEENLKYDKDVYYPFKVRKLEQLALSFDKILFLDDDKDLIEYLDKFLTHRNQIRLFWVK